MSAGENPPTSMSEAGSARENLVIREQPAGKPAVISGFFPPTLIVAQLSAVRDKQPVAALASANQHRQVLTEEFLRAVERAVSDPTQDFAKHGMLFNYATYFLAQWREPRAYPLFIRWLSLPGEDSLELGGDTIDHHGARLLASVAGSDTGPLKGLIVNPAAHPLCRGQALSALGVLMNWGDTPVEEVQDYFLFLAREGLERKSSLVWKALAAVCTHLELLPVFPELRRACQEGLLEPSFMTAKDLDAIEQAPRGALLKRFTQYHAPITDVARETRWWGGFQRGAQPRIAPAGPGANNASPKAGRNDPCPCGSGKKFKKCCGS